MFTDVFHLAHGMFGMYLGEMVAIAYAGTEMMQLVVFAAVSLAYSTAFELWLRFMQKL
jgi:uncharacterized membrane protein